MDDIDELNNGQWKIDCVRITVTQNLASRPRVFSGPGHLQQGSNGVIQYKIFDIVNSAHCLSLEQDRGLVPGQFVDADRYFRLEAVDGYDRCWCCDRTLPTIDELGAHSHYVIKGTAEELSHSRPSLFPKTLTRFSLVLFSNTQIPCNAATTAVTTVGTRTPQNSYHRNVAEFSTKFGEFQVVSHADRINVSVVPSASGPPFPKFIEQRIVEALSFVLGKRLDWNVASYIGDGNETMRVRGERFNSDSPKSRYSPAGADLICMLRIIGGCSQIIWSLFASILNRYFTLVLGTYSLSFKRTRVRSAQEQSL